MMQELPAAGGLRWCALRPPHSRGCTSESSGALHDWLVARCVVPRLGMKENADSLGWAVGVRRPRCRRCDRIARRRRQTFASAPAIVALPGCSHGIQGGQCTEKRGRTRANAHAAASAAPAPSSLSSACHPLRPSTSAAAPMSSSVLCSACASPAATSRRASRRDSSQGYEALPAGSRERSGVRGGRDAGAMLGPRWGHAGATLGPRWGHAGATLGPRWGLHTCPATTQAGCFRSFIPCLPTCQRGLATWGIGVELHGAAYARKLHVPVRLALKVVQVVRQLGILRQVQLGGQGREVATHACGRVCVGITVPPQRGCCVHEACAPPPAPPAASRCHSPRRRCSMCGWTPRARWYIALYECRW